MVSTGVAARLTGHRLVAVAISGAGFVANMTEMLGSGICRCERGLFGCRSWCDRRRSWSARGAADGSSAGRHRPLLVLNFMQIALVAARWCMWGLIRGRLSVLVTSCRLAMGVQNAAARGSRARSDDAVLTLTLTASPPIRRWRADEPRPAAACRPRVMFWRAVGAYLVSTRVYRRTRSR